VSAPDADNAAEKIAAARKLFAGACDFIWGTGDINSLPPQSLAEIAFVGRSNAGKSSLINALTNRKTLARVSHTPGRTREINFFNLGGQLILTDLPGYGYAKASKTMTAEWQKLIFAYLRGRASLRRVSLLIDARRGVLDLDEAVMTLLDEAAVSYGLVLTKIDKLSPGEIEKAVNAADAAARKHTAAFPQICATSAFRGLGLDPLKLQLAALAER
jgi:GTP-binding protein